MDIKKDPLRGSELNQSYFEVYNSIFENETFVTNLTDLEKVTLMFIASEMNVKEAAERTEGKAAIMRFGHHWMGAALSTNRQKIPQTLRQLTNYGFFNYTRGYRVNNGKKAPSNITSLAPAERYAKIDRYTFEFLLFEALKNKKIKYRHIVVYALCKYIEQFRGGSATVNEFGHALGLTAKNINYSRIKTQLEDLQAAQLINFERRHGKITGIQVSAKKLSREKRYQWRKRIKEEAEKNRATELGINLDTTAAIEDIPESKTMPEVYAVITDLFNKLTGKTAVLSAEQKDYIGGSDLTVTEIHNLSVQFFAETPKRQIMKADGKYIFKIVFNHVRLKETQLNPK